MHAYTDPVTKTISLSDEAYELLSKAKRPGESFSDVATRLAHREMQRRLFDRDLRVEMTEEEADAAKAAIYRARDESAEPRVDLA